MPFRKRNSPQSWKGQSLVEIAITLPVVLLLILGTFDFGMAIFSYSTLRDAAQEGALYGSFDPANWTEIESRARNIAPVTNDGFSSPVVDLRNTTLVKVSIKTPGGACQGETDGVTNSVQVNVSYDYVIMTPFINRFINSGKIPLSATVTNTILQPACQ